MMKPLRAFALLAGLLLAACAAAPEEEPERKQGGSGVPEHQLIQ